MAKLLNKYWFIHAKGNFLYKYNFIGTIFTVSDFD